MTFCEQTQPIHSKNNHALVEKYEPFVQSIARKVKRTLSPCIETDDLVAYGMTGLLESAQRFNPQLGVSFTTFSYYRIRGAMYDGLRTMGFMNRSEYQKIKFGERANAYLEDAAINKKDDNDAHELEDLAQQVRNLVTIYVTSLDNLETEIPDNNHEQQDNMLANQELKQLVRKSVHMLSDNDRKVIELYYFGEKNLEEVGQQLGLSKSWICRRHAQAIKSLEKIMRGFMETGERRTYVSN